MDTNSAQSRNVVQVVSRGGADLDEALLTTLDALVAKALARYRMAGFPRPFAKGRDRYNHLFRMGEHQALCQGLSVIDPLRLRYADLAQIDCVACLHEFTERTRP